MKSVIIYSLSTCPWCKKAKRYFEGLKIPYDNIDYDLADDKKQESINKDMRDMDAGGFPVVKIGRDVIVGYQPDRYAELLGLRAAG